MKVKDLINQLKECNPDADVFNVLYDNQTDNLSLVVGIDNRNNYVVLFEKIAWDSPNKTSELRNENGIFKKLFGNSFEF